MAGGRGVEGHQADGLWAEPEKDSLPPGKDSHTSWRCPGIVRFSRIPRTGKVNVGVLGEQPTPQGPVSAEGGAGLKGSRPAFQPSLGLQLAV